jgi:hypothetical protein
MEINDTEATWRDLFAAHYKTIASLRKHSPDKITIAAGRAATAAVKALESGDTIPAPVKTAQRLFHAEYLGDKPAPRKPTVKRKKKDDFLF